MADDNVTVVSWPDFNVSAKAPIPVCIKVCEPICVRSEYVVSIDIFDRNVATIKVSGQTTIFNCNDQRETK
jgi:hypothetical protein